MQIRWIVQGFEWSRSIHAPVIVTEAGCCIAMCWLIGFGDSVVTAGFGTVGLLWGHSILGSIFPSVFGSRDLFRAPQETA
jgi:hypothetical protein